MKIKVLLPWLCVLGCSVGLALIYSSNQQKDAELGKLRAESQELQNVQAELEQKTSQLQTEGEELARLRNDNKELLRLRNEIQQLRQSQQQLTKQVAAGQAQYQTAQTQVQTAQAEMQALRAGATQAIPAAAPQPDSAAAQAFAKRYGLNLTPEQLQVNTCVNNLRQIDGAKMQWALENNRPTGGLVGLNDLTTYFKSNTVPTCPAGGSYTINPIGIAPICTLPGHGLGK